MLQYKSRGFTLIELMVVISIISILSAVGLTAYSKSQMAGRDARRKQDLNALSVALEAYYQQKGQYPTGAFNSCETSGSHNWSTFVGDLTGGPQSFISQVPTDPQNTPSDPDNAGSSIFPNVYCYYYSSNMGTLPSPNQFTSPNFYALGARLEAPIHPADSSCPGSGYQNYCPGSNCQNYHDEGATGVDAFNFYGACSANYVITSPK